jgi:anti-anti-sigma factor
MADTSSMLLDESRYRIARAFAIGVVISAALFGVIVLALLLTNPNLGLAIILGLMVLDIVVGSVALTVQKHRPLWEIIVALASTLGIGVVVAGILFPDAKMTIISIFIVIVLLVNLLGHTRLTIGSLVACALITVGMILTPALPGLTMSFGWALPIVQGSTTISVIVLVWMISERQTATLITAIGQTNQRAAEAEAARSEAEAARSEVERRNNEQARLLDLVQSLELPVIPIGQGVLVMPLVGSLDSRRVEAIQRRLLEAVSHERSHTVVLDVTAISVIDTSVARQLLLTAQAVRLLGARTMLSGISAQVAQTLVTLGVALDDLQPVGDLGQALDTARQN